MGSQRAATNARPEAASTLDPFQQALAPEGSTLGVKRQDEMLVWLSSKPAQPARGAAEIDAYLVSTDGQPVTAAKVTFDTDMTNMSHGQYLVPAQPAGDGHYVGQVHFSMPGPWRVIAIVERAGHEPARVRFEFSVSSK